MRHHLRGRAIRLCSLAAGATSAVVAAAIALPAAATSAPGMTGTAASAAPHKAAAITLINGDRLAVKNSPVGPQQVAVHKAGGTDSLLSMRLGGTTYEIPADALPYLRHGLDLSLFSLANLQREEKSGRLPVTISYTGTRPRLPGVTITRSGRGSARGYLTAASARAFGDALARQFVSDHARATYGQDGMFAHGVDIALAGVPVITTPVRPAYQMRTLTVQGRNLKGQKDSGDVIFVFNAANANIFGGPDGEGLNFFWKGSAKYSVPVGTYWAISEFFSFGKHGTSPQQRIVVLPQFTVKNATTVHVNERSASSQITTATPRPAVTSQLSIEFIRYGLRGSVNGMTVFENGVPLFVSPTTAKPTVGGLRTYTTATLTNPPKTTGTPYFYNLDFQGPAGIIPPQHYVLTPADLATVNEVFYQDVKSSGGWNDFGGFAGQFAGPLLSEVFPFRLPTRQVQYFSAGPSIAWQFQYMANFNSYSFANNSFSTLPAGGQLTEDWNAYPLHPQPDVQLLTGAFAAELPQLPSAFRVGNFLVWSETPFSDNYPGHMGDGLYGPFGGAMPDSYDFYQNGKRIAHGNPATFGIPPVKVSRKPSTIRFVLNAATWGPRYPLSPATSTAWTWKSRAEPTATVPHSWYCGFTVVRRNVVPDYRCSIQPLLTLNYQVQGLSLTGYTAPGPQTVDVSVSHLQLAAASAITGLTAAYSLNDGQSWNAASVTAAGGGEFHIGFSAPASTDVTLRVSATDAAGNSITETIVRAYGVSS